MNLHESMTYKTQWVIRRYVNDDAFARGESYRDSIIDGNLCSPRPVIRPEPVWSN